MSSQRLVFSCMLAAMTAGAAAADGRGLVVDPEQLSWPTLQARLQLSTEPLSPALASIEGMPLRPRSAALFGDYYVSRPFFGHTGGMRVTSGVVTGPRGAVFGPGQATTPGLFGFSAVSRGANAGFSFADVNGESSQTLPYLGIGYSGSSMRGGWGFSADLGLTAQNAGAQRLMRSIMSQSLDDTLRELRLTPVLQLGVSYRF